MIVVKIRPYSATNEPIMNMLKCVTENTIRYLMSNDINLTNVRTFIWIKEYENIYFPKLEFDYAGEELQYDISTDGRIIKEVHFKTFAYDNSLKKNKRIDIEKKDANVLLQKIDDLLRCGIETQ